MAKDGVAEDADGNHDDARNGCVVVVIPYGQWDATQIGTNGIAEIEGKLHHATSQQVTTFTESKQEQLLRRAHSKQAESGDAHQQHAEPCNVAEQENTQQTCEHDDLQQSTRMPWTYPVAEHSTSHVAHHHSCTCNDRHQRQERCTDA